MAVSFCIGLVGYVAFTTRKADPKTRQRSILWSLPMAFGFALSFYPFQSGIPAVIGFGTTIALAVWFNVLRHPVEFRQALKQFQAGEKLRALELVTSSIKKNSTHWESYQFRSVIYAALFRVVKAERDARTAMRLEPDNHICYNALGQALLAQERYLEANDAFSKAIELAPHYTVNHYTKGLVCYRLEQFDEAIKYLEFAVRGRMHFEEWQLLANYYLGRSLLQVGDTQKAQRAFRALGQFRRGYNKLVNLYQDIPHYPTVLQIRRELEDISGYLT
ncbi:MAG: tetratricopeptide repeat protein [Aestuariibacter sp.]|nr:tetratricopeptide repeat protein [Aestuariibacter sp.]